MFQTSLNNQSLPGKQVLNFPGRLSAWPAQARIRPGPRWTKGLLGMFVSKAIVIIIITVIPHGAPALEPSLALLRPQIGEKSAGNSASWWFQRLWKILDSQLGWLFHAIPSIWKDQKWSKAPTRFVPFQSCCKLCILILWLHFTKTCRLPLAMQMGKPSCTSKQHHLHTAEPIAQFQFSTISAIKSWMV